ncbi:MAG TPA: J domain-containing protein [Geopsychrobacteraceae bacterium]|nr:J domain-containing protein [Geopsychrobacteraceae bacterium]
MQQISESEILHACRVLFGSELHLSRGFLNYLQPSGARTAYRKKAMLTHPDRFVSSCSIILAKQKKLFQSLNQAHEVVQSYLRQRNIAPVDLRQHPQAAQNSRPHRRRPTPDTNRFYRGTLPNRPLQLAQFLYYESLIPYAAVISAITWQRQQRPSVGQIAQRWRWLNDKDIDRILKLRSGFSRFGERAQQLGLLNPLQVRTLLLHQRANQKQIGRYFVDHGYITEKNLERLLDKLSEHNLKYRHGFSGQYYTRS